VTGDRKKPVPSRYFLMRVVNNKAALAPELLGTCNGCDRSQYLFSLYLLAMSGPPSGEEQK
jgi:hypothetical protein